MSVSYVRFRRCVAILSAVLGLSLVTACAEEVAPAAIALPPAGAGVDYQLGGAYPPPAGVRIVGRDHTATPAPELYNFCYVNAFQAQPHAEGEWDADLLLRDANGTVVIDNDWDEALLDLRTDSKRQRIADKVNGWVNECAAKGFQAVEPDNYDSFTRSQSLLSADDAQSYVRLLSAHAHSKGLAIAQKNTSELADRRQRNGLDFAVAEQCGEQKNCDEFTSAFGNQVYVIEYTGEGLSEACGAWGGKLSIVQRDRPLVAAGRPGYLHGTC